MSSRRQLHLGAFMRPASIHTGAWRYPGGWPDINFNFSHMKESIQKLERAKFDAFFMADEHADRCAKAKPYRDLVRAVHAAVCPVLDYRADRPRRDRLLSVPARGGNRGSGIHGAKRMRLFKSA